MIDFMTFVSETSLVFISIASPIVLGLVEIVKRVGMRKRYNPIVSLIFGISAGVFYGGYTLSYNILLGILVGLASSGLWSGVKTVKNG